MGVGDGVGTLDVVVVGVGVVDVVVSVVVPVVTGVWII